MKTRMALSPVDYHPTQRYAASYDGLDVSKPAGLTVSLADGKKAEELDQRDLRCCNVQEEELQGSLVRQNIVIYVGADCQRFG